MYFEDFGFHPDLMEGISSMGYVKATPIQEQVFGPVTEGKDIIAAAQTGTGKTAAFLLPLLQKLMTTPHDNHSVNAMIIVPTRELAIQISQILEGITYFTDISFIAIYGGNNGTLFANERKALSQGADIIVCTPGRMIAHLNMGYVKFSGLKYLVLDEADRMLDMGFLEDIMRIVATLPAQRQNLLFSATMPPLIRKLAHTLLKNPIEVNIAVSKPPETIKQQKYLVHDAQKPGLIQHILKNNASGYILIFCSSKQSVKNLYALLARHKYKVGQIQSDLEQSAREQILLDYKNKKINILIATDILSRGIDIEDIELVINYDVPNEGEDYIHRIGRTARAASTGTAITLVCDKEQWKFQKIEKLLGREVECGLVPEELGPAPQPRINNNEGANKKKKFKPKRKPNKPSPGA